MKQFFTRLPKQLLAINPFEGDSQPSRVRLFAPGSGRPSLPFPHPWNYTKPIQILETFFGDAEQEQGLARQNRYLNNRGGRPISH